MQPSLLSWYDESRLTPRPLPFLAHPFLGVASIDHLHHLANPMAGNDVTPTPADSATAASAAVTGKTLAYNTVVLARLSPAKPPSALHLSTTRPPPPPSTLTLIVPLPWIKRA